MTGIFHVGLFDYLDRNRIIKRCFAGDKGEQQSSSADGHTPIHFLYSIEFTAASSRLVVASALSG